MGTGDEQTLRQREEPTASDERSEYFCTKRFNVSIFTIGLDRQKKKNLHTIGNIFLPISFEICFGCSIEPSH